MTFSRLPKSIPARVHFSGIGGAGMSGLAQVLHDAGIKVSGSDRDLTAVVSNLRENGIPIRLEQNGLPEETNLLVHTAAMPQDHPELRDAKRQGIPMIKRAELLARLCETDISVAVAGTHGKTTICSILAWLLHRCLPDSGWFVGGQVPGLPSAKIGKGQLTICEADEFDRSFLRLKPTHLLLGKIDWDHVDCYPRPVDLHQAIDQLAENMRGNGPIFMQSDLLDNGPGQVKYWPADKILKQHALITVGFDQSADLQIHTNSNDPTRFRLVSQNQLKDTCEPLELKFNLPGAHNRLNAAIAVGWLMHGNPKTKISPEMIAKALFDFPGVERRFQTICQVKKRVLVDDYAHHPSEICAFINAAREYYKCKITVIHQPHTFSRLKAFAAETAQALMLADKVAVWPVFAAREEAIPGCDHKYLASLAEGDKITAVDDLNSLLNFLRDGLEENELIATVGAGDLYLYHNDLTELIKGNN
jgi:UDP-N-acetylmuramate--alanine ligase